MWQTKVNLVDLDCIVCFWKLKSSSPNEPVNGQDFLWFEGLFVTFQKPVCHAQHRHSLCGACEKLCAYVGESGPRQSYSILNKHSSSPALCVVALSS